MEFSGIIVDNRSLADELIRKVKAGSNFYELAFLNTLDPQGKDKFTSTWVSTYDSPPEVLRIPIGGITNVIEDGGEYLVLQKVSDISKVQYASLLKTNQKYDGISSLVEANRNSEAIELLKEVIESDIQSLGTENHPIIALSMNDLAFLYQSEGLIKEAEQLYMKTLEIRRRFFNRYHPKVSQSLIAVANFYKDIVKDIAKAEPLYRELMDVYPRLYGELNDDFVALNNQLGVIKYDLGQLEEAEPYYLKGLALGRQLYGDSDLSVANGLYELGYLYKDLGRYNLSLDRLEEALIIYRANNSDDHELLIDTLFKIATVHNLLGSYAKAETSFLESLQLSKKVHGEVHNATANIEQQLGITYNYLDKYQLAIDHFNNALAIRRKNSEENTLEVADLMHLLGDVTHTIGNYPKAESLLVSSLEIYRKILEEDDFDLMSNVGSLALLYRDMGRLGEAELILKDLLTTRRTVLETDPQAISNLITNIAEINRLQGRYTEAESLNLEALSYLQETSAEDQPHLSIVLSNFADLYIDLAKYKEAEDLLKKAIRIERSIGGDAAGMDIQVSLARAYREAGNFAEAERLLEEVLAIYRSRYGESHPNVGATMVQLASLYFQQGRYKEAEALHKMDIELTREFFGSAHSDVANALGGLARLYMIEGRLDEAEPLYEESLDIYTETLGFEHPYVTEVMHLMSRMYIYQGRYEEASSFIERVFERQLKTFGENHPNVSSLYSVRAELAFSQKRYEAAGSLLQKSEEIMKQFVDESHPSMLAIHGRIAIVDLIQGRKSDAFGRLTKVVQQRDAFIRNTFPYSTENEREQFLSTQTDYLSHIVSLIDESDDDQIRSVFDLILNNKALSIDFGVQQRQFLGGETPEIERLYSRLTALIREIASMTFSNREVGSSNSQEYLKDLLEKREAVEDSLARRSGAFAVEQRKQRATSQSIAQTLTDNQHLIEYVRIEPDDYWTEEVESVRQPPHYVAFALSASNEVTMTNLGSASAIDSLISLFRTEIERFNTNMGENQRQSALHRTEDILGELGRLLWDPLGLPEGKEIFISPDAIQHLLPFETLITDSGEYTIDQFTISYVGTGRDIIGFDEETFTASPMYVFADPDYDGEAISSGPVLAYAAPLARDIRDIQFPRLPGTYEEAVALTELFKLNPDRVLTNALASEETLVNVSSPAVLHIATHGFFLADLDEIRVFDKNLNRLIDDPSSQIQADFELSKWDNPLLRSGLALAGANLTLSGENPPGGYDGIVTAYELSGMNLQGTQLVVLSACGTGQGEIVNDEGVFGLRRSFQLAGAESVVMSLWNVDDTSTAQLMVEFYERLSRGESKVTALREAALSLRSSPEFNHPYYWGAFIHAGDPN